jgi:hypothetical protein
MTALAADKRLEIIAGPPNRYRYGKAKGSVIIYKGAAICRDLDGYLVPGANTAGYKFVGWSEEHVDTTGIADGVSEVKYKTAMSAKMVNAAGGDAVAQKHLGAPVYLADDQTVRGTPGNGVRVGIAEYIDTDLGVFVYGGPEISNVDERVIIPYDHIQVTADTTIKLFTVPAGKKLRLLKAEYVNPTGLAQDATNYFTIKVLKGATVMASWSTLTGAQGTIAADTFVDLVNSATDADLVADAAAVISLFLDETAAATLPAGRIVLHGVLVPTA